MKTEVDEEKFNAYQRELVRYLLKSSKRILKTNEVAEETIEGIAEDLVFDVAAVLDGSASLADGDSMFNANVVFVDGEGQNEKVILSENGSHMHELVYPIAEELFEKEGIDES